MKKVPIDKIRTSTTTKVAGLSILAVLAVAFFAFPLGAFAAASAPKATAKVKFYAAYELQSSNPNGPVTYWPDAKTSFQNLTPIAVTITTNVTADQISQIPAGAIVQVKTPGNTDTTDSDGDGDQVLPYTNALCIGKNQVTYVTESGKQVIATLT